MIRDLDRAQAQTFERPNAIVAGDVVDPPDFVIVAVRGEQIDDALTVTRPYLAAHTSVAVVPPLMDDLLARVREAGITQPTFSMLIGLGVWPVGDELHWFRFPGGAILLSCEGDAGALAAAEELEAVLRDAGLRAHTGIVMPPFVRAMVAGEKALLMGWELADWDIDQLLADSELRALTSAAIVEAASVVLADEAETATAVLAQMPSLEQRATQMGDNMRAIWRYHGPKRQIRLLVDALIDRGRRGKAPVDELRKLRARLAS